MGKVFSGGTVRNQKAKGGRDIETTESDLDIKKPKSPKKELVNLSKILVNG